MRVVYPDSLFTILNRVCLPRFSLYNPKEGLFNPDSSFKPMKRLFFTTILHSQPLIGLYMDNSSKNTKNHPNLESCGKIRENGLFSGEFADKKRKWKSKSCSEDLNPIFPILIRQAFGPKILLVTYFLGKFFWF